MNETVHPPVWAEAILRLTLRKSDRAAISGDLLEEYRTAIVPSRGERPADAWYLRQVSSYVWRSTWVWALIFGGQFVARCAYDWAVPTHDFHVRAEFSTQFGVMTMLTLAVWASWRSGLCAAAPVLTAIAGLLAAIFSVSTAMLLYTLWPDPAGHLDRAIAESGGMDEVYFLPFMMIVPAVIIGIVGGAVGSLSRRLLN